MAIFWESGGHSQHRGQLTRPLEASWLQCTPGDRVSGIHVDPRRWKKFLVQPWRLENENLWKNDTLYNFIVNLWMFICEVLYSETSAWIRLNGFKFAARRIPRHSCVHDMFPFWLHLCELGPIMTYHNASLLLWSKLRSIIYTASIGLHKLEQLNAEVTR